MDPIGRWNETGNVYGIDCMTGRPVLPTENVRVTIMLLFNYHFRVPRNARSLFERVIGF